MCEAVEMVALPAEQPAERVAGQGTGPRIVRDLGVGIVRPTVCTERRIAVSEIMGGPGGRTIPAPRRTPR